MASRDLSPKRSARPDAEPMFLRLDSVLRITGLGRSTVFRLIASKDFPAPVRVGVRAIAWRKADLDRWSESREVVQ